MCSLRDNGAPAQLVLFVPAPNPQRSHRLTVAAGLRGFPSPPYTEVEVHF
jgi:hypothetical protein